ncbi:MAG: homoserine O-acetyltransferase [Gammaproteobacteria bacterium]|nr:homoserine O-acetyltransferase [Gammaproteobacteria bacterium]
MSTSTLDVKQTHLRATAATKFVTLRGDYGTGDFVMHRGGVLKEVVIAYESWGTLSDNNDNVVLVFGGLSPSAHACSSEQDQNKGWWEYMIGPEKPIDTNKYYVVCVNTLGSCFGSTSPASINPETGKVYGLDFPDLSIEDVAKSAHHALLDLGIDHLHTVVGSSMGGMSALAYALMYPQEVDHLISISAATRALPFTIAVRSLQREIIRCDPAFKNGLYDPNEEPTSGMVLARKLGLMSYRAAEEWHQRFNRARISADRKSNDRFGIEFEVESYLDYNAHKFVKTFDANSYLYLSRAMDLFDVADHGGSVNAGLAMIQAKSALIIGVETDILFPVHQQQEIADGIRKTGRPVEFVQLDSINGHDSFLVDEAHFAPVMRNFFEQNANT